ncbi:hypothetical protein BKA66DRAFT_449046 [Pyrenochaeta sp. MPI-SDFR-AT-0127]|nr:hypothetical protein BKA66DRAFT_449046 [Pyrenochaeta sp. MPI-SDFR-AT-0127]
MTGRLDDDEYVANLLKEDAKSATKKYELVGIDAFNPKRIKSGAPKPNTSFLRHIIRQTDSHNAALLAREAEESHARLKTMDREMESERRKEAERKRKKADGRLTPLTSDSESQYRRSKQRSDYGTGREKERRAGEHHDHKEESCRRRRGKSIETRREKRRHEHSDKERSTRKRRRPHAHRDEERRYRHGSEEQDDRSRRRDYRDHKGYSRRSRRSKSRSTSRSRSRSRSPRTSKHESRHKRRDLSYSPHRASRNSMPKSFLPNSKYSARSSKPRSTSPASDSDPLEALIGPLLPSAQSLVRARGRGAHKTSAMDMDSRFSTNYDPTTDVRPDSDGEDDWGNALEALRDRQRWQQQGADRLKAAGFTDEQVKKWEKGESQNEDDVVWARNGQAREWDRGKVVDEDGHVELKADFGRLK